VRDVGFPLAQRQARGCFARMHRLDIHRADQIEPYQCFAEI
jgi:hypothetical protein